MVSVVSIGNGGWYWCCPVRINIRKTSGAVLKQILVADDLTDRLAVGKALRVANGYGWADNKVFLLSAVGIIDFCTLQQGFNVIPGKERICSDFFDGYRGYTRGLADSRHAMGARHDCCYHGR